MNFTAIYWDDLCGDKLQGIGPFWDPYLSWETHNPDLPQCLQSTVLQWVPAGFLWIASTFYFIYLDSQPSVGKWNQKSYLNTFKIVFCLVLAVFQLGDLSKAISDDVSGSYVPLAYFVTPCVMAATYFLAAVVSHVEFQKGFHTSAILFIFWFFKLVLDIIPFRSKIMQATGDDQKQFGFWFYAVTFFVSYALIMVQFLMTFKSDLSNHSSKDEESLLLLVDSDDNGNLKKKEFKHKPCPEETTNFLSSYTHLWVLPTIIKGYRRELKFEDTFELKDEHKTTTVVKSFLEKFTERCKKKKGKKKSSAMDLIISLMASNSQYLLISGFARLLFSAGTFVQPIILQLLIGFIERQDEYSWRGYLYSVILLVAGILQSTFIQCMFKYTYITGMRMRAALMASVYRKALRFSNTTRKQKNVGAIVNLMSIDAQVVHDIILVVHDFWAAPLVIIVTLIMLWNVIGISCLAGMAVLCVLAPINGFLIRRFAHLQVEQMKYKDSRIRMINQVLSGIKVLKMYAWESSFGDIVRSIRADELKCCRHQFFLAAAIGVTFNFAPYLISLAIFATYTLSSPDNFLDPQTAFVTLNLVTILTWYMSSLPANLGFLTRSIVSLRRLAEAFSSEEIDENMIKQDRNMEPVLSMEDASFAWDMSKEENESDSSKTESETGSKGETKKSDANGFLPNDHKPNGAVHKTDDDESLKVPETLKSLNLEILEGQLVAVVGIVGSGKSSLLSSVLGELYKTSGSIRIKGTIAYVPQQAWMQNTSLKGNILFGKKYVKGHYEKILEHCALLPDLKILPAGDATEIGEKGINLSGGQKQRISLARAVYQNEDIYLLDDPLSAVDAHVGKHLFEKVVGPKGMLKDKTRVLVTHAVTFLPNADSIIVMKNGAISETGTYAELLEKNGEFAQFLRNYLQEKEVEEEDLGNEEELEVRKEMLRQLSAMSGTSELSDSHGKEFTTYGSLRLRKRVESESVETKSENLPTADRSKLMTKEELSSGGLSLAVLKTYVKAGGYAFLGAVILFEILYVGTQVCANIWLSYWSSDLPPGNYSGTIVEDKTSLRLGVYGAFGVVQVIAIFGVSACLYVGATIAAATLHANILDRIIKAPMAFFDTTPVGRIVNRFSSDMEKIDATIPMVVRWWLTELSFVLSTLIVVSYVTPIFLVVAIPLMAIFIIIQRLYIVCIRQLKRMESAMKSPIYANFDETLVGVTCIRAYRQQKRFIAKNDELCDQTWMPWYIVIVAQRWLGFALECLGSILVFFASLFAILAKDTITPSEAGLSVSYAMQLISCINMMVRAATDLETHVVSVERIKEYTEVKTEAQWIEDDHRPPKGWPHAGMVTFDNYSTRYRPGLDLVLKDLSFTVNPGEKLGVVGRTGAGKSSITLSMFRIIEPAGGAIYIDGINVSEIGLHDLRNALTIIPQDPVLFSGSLRRNLDPFDHYSDHDLWNTLEHAYLKAFVLELDDGLEYECGEGGEALSVGQRQLVCLARALLRKTKILILDEATASVDLETDELIQNTIRTKFTECSVITIAHRLNTIMDYDRVMVLDKGKIIEIDSPANLFSNEENVFYKMAQDAGLLNNASTKL